MRLDIHVFLINNHNFPYYVHLICPAELEKKKDATESTYLDILLKGLLNGHLDFP
jgi:hypothetical protein